MLSGTELSARGLRMFVLLSGAWRVAKAGEGAGHPEGKCRLGLRPEAHGLCHGFSERCRVRETDGVAEYQENLQERGRSEPSLLLVCRCVPSVRMALHTPPVA